MDDYEIKVDHSTFVILSAIAKAEDDPHSLVNLTEINPEEFREFVISSGGIEDNDALELLSAAEHKHFSDAAIISNRARGYATGMKLYVGNLSFTTSSEDLQKLFSEAGTVESVSVIEDRDTGRSRGFGFVEMASKEEGEAAIQQFNGQEFEGRNLTVNEASSRERTGQRGGSDSARERGRSR
jgi:cold-inducible RNA-binding protein